MLYTFSESEAAELLELALHQLVLHASEYHGACGPSADECRSMFIQTARIVCELDRSTVPLHEPESSRSDQREDSETAYMRELARREGLDFDKEFGPIDPRALKPKCVHGRLFTQVCPECEGRCAHGLEQTMPCAACGRGVAEPLAFDGRVWPMN
jgi:hypothetical protein